MKHLPEKYQPIKHLPDLTSITKDEILDLIKLGIDIKHHPGKFKRALSQKSMAMWFEKPSLRTRVSYEAAMTQLGGHAIYLDPANTHAKKAKIEDEIKCISKFVDVIIGRVYEQETIHKMISSSEVPVINALCNKHHPCQALADLMTVFEVFEKPSAITIAYVGDGNNVCNSLINGAKTIGIRIQVATPTDLKPDYEADLWTKDPCEAVKGADITDTWVSMGNESGAESYINKLKKYQVNKKLIENKYFMHCLPAIRGQEVTDEVIDSEKSLVFRQAENRLHVQKAILVKLMK